MRYKNTDAVAIKEHGEWVDIYNGEYDNAIYKCSVCGGTAIPDFIRNVQILSHFCPHCGAKMSDVIERSNENAE